MSGLLAGCAAQAPAASPSGSSAALTETPTLSADTAAIQRATGVMQALGFQVPAGVTATVGATDPATQGLGTVVSLGKWDVEWNSQGMLTQVFVPPSASAAAKVTSVQAAARVTQILTALGETLPAPDSLVYEDTVPDWAAVWSRTIDGVPASNDGTKIVLTPDGQFISYWHAESTLAPKPAQPLTGAQAMAKYPSCKNSSNGPNGKTETCSARLVWYRATTTSPDQPIRLCWEVKYGWSDNNQGFGGWVDYLDAGTGEVIDAAAIS
jgi:hypothetical protein